MEHVDPQEAKRLIDEEGAVLIDCREDFEWDEMRIPGATLAPLSELEMDPELVEEADIVIFQCAHGHRSQSAASIYEGVHPQARAITLDGGIADWAAKGLPTDFGPPPNAS
jgi:rhodanese-related sulfurtransferase